MSDKIGKYNVTDIGDKLIITGESMTDKTVTAPSGDLVTINGAWYIDNLPQNIVCELTDGTLKMFYITPFKPQKTEKMLAYNGYHPRKMKGSPLPDYLYRFYGLQKNAESATEVIHVRLTPSEKIRVENWGKNQEPTMTVSETVRAMIRTLDNG
jgi:hypothetical protein